MTKEDLESTLVELTQNQRDEKGDILFLDIDTEKTKNQIIRLYEAITKRNLKRADPIRLFLETIAYIIIQQRVLINHTGKMNLLRYAKGDFLEELGYFAGAERIQATAALTTLKITLSEKRETITFIPKGVRVTAGDHIFFELVEDVVILIGEIEAEVIARCTEAGIIGNDYAVGEINQIVDPQPFVLSMVNITKSQGGSETESDDRYRLRIHEAPESYSSAGPDGAYRFYAMDVNPLIIDAKPIMAPNPGDVTVYILMKNGEIPGNEILEEVYKKLSPDDIRPLTDHVFVKAPDVVSYNIEGAYYIHSSDMTRTTEIEANIKKALEEYVLWQKSAIARDINSSKLIQMIVSAGAKRVELKNPSFIKLNETQVAKEANVNLVFGGFEDD